MFNVGLQYGLGLAATTAEERQQVEGDIQQILQRYEAITASYQSFPAARASARNNAMYFAAGMYLNEKIFQYKTSCWKMSYAEQRAFCESYGTQDHVPRGRIFNDFGGMDYLAPEPYALIQLSKQEWRAIEAVALGIAEPSQTPYPQQMQAIKNALVHMGMFYDQPAHAQRLERQKAPAMMSAAL